MTLNQSIGRVAREARTGRGWSQIEMARRIGCAPSTVQEFEHGTITWQKLCECAQALKITAGGLVSMAEEMLPVYTSESQRRARMLERMSDQ